jgi:FkbM family methyltransferase
MTASMREAFFLSVARYAARLPPLAGKTRLFLELLKVLGLRDKHIHVETVLQRPLPFRVRLDLHSWLQRIAYLTGGYEADTVSFLHKVWASHGGRGYCLDVGANIGLIAIPLALMLERELPAPKVVAIEAVRDNFNALKVNLELNGLSAEIVAINTGVGDSAETVDIQVEGDLEDGQGTGTANILPQGSRYECVRQTLRMTTIDRLASTAVVARGCALVKIDTDGYDLKVLEGARDFLARERPVIFGEFAAHCLSWHGQTVQDVIQFGMAHGYVVWRRLDGWRFSDAIDAAAFVQDLLLVPVESVDRFGWCLAHGGGLAA